MTDTGAAQVKKPKTISKLIQPCPMGKTGEFAYEHDPRALQFVPLDTSKGWTPTKSTFIVADPTKPKGSHFVYKELDWSKDTVGEDFPPNAVAFIPPQSEQAQHTRGVSSKKERVHYQARLRVDFSTERRIFQIGQFSTYAAGAWACDYILLKTMRACQAGSVKSKVTGKSIDPPSIASNHPRVFEKAMKGKIPILPAPTATKAMDNQVAHPDSQPYALKESKLSPTKGEQQQTSSRPKKKAENDRGRKKKSSPGSRPRQKTPPPAFDEQRSNYSYGGRPIEHPDPGTVHLRHAWQKLLQRRQLSYQDPHDTKKHSLMESAPAMIGAKAGIMYLNKTGKSGSGQLARVGVSSQKSSRKASEKIYPPRSHSPCGLDTTKPLCDFCGEAAEDAEDVLRCTKTFSRNHRRCEDPSFVKENSFPTNYIAPEIRWLDILSKHAQDISKLVNGSIPSESNSSTQKAATASFLSEVRSRVVQHLTPSQATRLRDHTTSWLKQCTEELVKLHSSVLCMQYQDLCDSGIAATDAGNVSSPRTFLELHGFRMGPIWARQLEIVDARVPVELRMAVANRSPAGDTPLFHLDRLVRLVTGLPPMKEANNAQQASGYQIMRMPVVISRPELLNIIFGSFAEASRTTVSSEGSRTSHYGHYERQVKVARLFLDPPLKENFPHFYQTVNEGEYVRQQVRGELEGNMEQGLDRTSTVQGREGFLVEEAELREQGWHTAPIGACSLRELSNNLTTACGNTLRRTEEVKDKETQIGFCLSLLTSSLDPEKQMAKDKQAPTKGTRGLKGAEDSRTQRHALGSLQQFSPFHHLVNAQSHSLQGLNLWKADEDDADGVTKFTMSLHQIVANTDIVYERGSRLWRASRVIRDEFYRSFIENIFRWLSRISKAFDVDANIEEYALHTQRLLSPSIANLLSRSPITVKKKCDVTEDMISPENIRNAEKQITTFPHIQKCEYKYKGSIPPLYVCYHFDAQPKPRVPWSVYANSATLAMLLFCESEKRIRAITGGWDLITDTVSKVPESTESQKAEKHQPQPSPPNAKVTAETKPSQKGLEQGRKAFKSFIERKFDLDFEPEELYRTERSEDQLLNDDDPQTNNGFTMNMDDIFQLAEFSNLRATSHVLRCAESTNPSETTAEGGNHQQSPPRPFANFKRYLSLDHTVVERALQHDDLLTQSTVKRFKSAPFTGGLSGDGTSNAVPRGEDNQETDPVSVDWLLHCLLADHGMSSAKAKAISSRACRATNSQQKLAYLTNSSITNLDTINQAAFEEDLLAVVFPSLCGNILSGRDDSELFGDLECALENIVSCISTEESVYTPRDWASVQEHRMHKRGSKCIRWELELEDSLEGIAEEIPFYNTCAQSRISHIAEVRKSIMSRLNGSAVRDASPLINGGNGVSAASCLRDITDSTKELSDAIKRSRRAAEIVRNKLFSCNENKEKLMQASTSSYEDVRRLSETILEEVLQINCLSTSFEAYEAHDKAKLLASTISTPELESVKCAKFDNLLKYLQEYLNPHALPRQQWSLLAKLGKNINSKVASNGVVKSEEEETTSDHSSSYQSASQTNVLADELKGDAEEKKSMEKSFGDGNCIAEEDSIGLESGVPSTGPMASILALMEWAATFCLETFDGSIGVDSIRFNALRALASPQKYWPYPTVLNVGKDRATSSSLRKAMIGSALRFGTIPDDSVSAFRPPAWSGAGASGSYCRLYTMCLISSLVDFGTMRPANSLSEKCPSRPGKRINRSSEATLPPAKFRKTNGSLGAVDGKHVRELKWRNAAAKTADTVAMENQLFPAEDLKRQSITVENLIFGDPTQCRGCRFGHDHQCQYCHIVCRKMADGRIMSPVEAATLVVKRAKGRFNLWNLIWRDGISLQGCSTEHTDFIDHLRLNNGLCSLKHDTRSVDEPLWNDSALLSLFRKADVHPWDSCQIPGSKEYEVSAQNCKSTNLRKVSLSFLQCFCLCIRDALYGLPIGATICQQMKDKCKVAHATNHKDSANEIPNCVERIDEEFSSDANRSGNLRHHQRLGMTPANEDAFYTYWALKTVEQEYNAATYGFSDTSSLLYGALRAWKKHVSSNAGLGYPSAGSVRRENTSSWASREELMRNLRSGSATVFGINGIHGGSNIPKPIEEVTNGSDRFQSCVNKIHDHSQTSGRPDGSPLEKPLQDLNVLSAVYRSSNPPTWEPNKSCIVPVNRLAERAQWNLTRLRLGCSSIDRTGLYATQDVEADDVLAEYVGKRTSAITLLS